MFYFSSFSIYMQHYLSSVNKLGTSDDITGVQSVSACRQSLLYDVFSATVHATTMPVAISPMRGVVQHDHLRVPDRRTDIRPGIRCG